MITAISDDPEIKQGLFPSPGGNVSTQNGGGKPKTEHQWAICVALFKDHPVYSTSFALAQTAKEKEKWTIKIKNWLKKYVVHIISVFQHLPGHSMSTKTHKYMEEMGQTGAGIEWEADINMDVPNTFTTKWGMYLFNC